MKIRSVKKIKVKGYGQMKPKAGEDYLSYKSRVLKKLDDRLPYADKIHIALYYYDRGVKK